jgi:hypothetical protein
MVTERLRREPLPLLCKKRVERLVDRGRLHHCVILSAGQHFSYAPRRVRVASLVDDKLPEAARWAGRSEVLEVEGENRSSHRLRDRHHATVDKPEVEAGEARVDLDRAPQEAGGEKRHRVLARGERLEKQARRASADSRTEKLVDLDQHRPGNHELSPQLGHKRRGETVRPVATIRRRDQRTRIRDDSQRALTRSRR